MMTNPVRTLTFDANGAFYAFTIDAELQRGKAQRIAEILDDEEIEAKMDNLPMGTISMTADGNIRPMAMRLIIDTLAA